MNLIPRCILTFYFQILHLYPRGFREEFAEEMKIVFRDSVHEAGEGGFLPLVLLCLREFGGLPINILREFLHEFKRKETVMVTNDKLETESIAVARASRWDALIGALPFVLFGFDRIIAKLDLYATHPYLDDPYLDLAFYIIVLIGFFWGLVKGAPRWTYSFLGWSLTMTWLSYWFIGAVTGFELTQFIWQTWVPFFAVIAAALAWTRSLTPLTQLVMRVWQDWTLLSLAMYAFIGLMMMDYDENHSPYLIAFIITTTVAISTIVWAFMRSTRALHRFALLVAGFVIGNAINWISETTWDVAAYYKLPPQPPMPWYDAVLDVITMAGFWGLILLLPALIGLARSSVKETEAN